MGWVIRYDRDLETREHRVVAAVCRRAPRVPKPLDEGAESRLGLMNTSVYRRDAERDIVGDLPYRNAGVCGAHVNSLHQSNPIAKPVGANESAETVLITLVNADLEEDAVIQLRKRMNEEIRAGIFTTNESEHGVASRGRRHSVRGGIHSDCPNRGCRD